MSFTSGSSPSSLVPSSESSDPNILLRATSDLESLRLGVGGSITVQFTVPIANYPAAGALTVERPNGALPCSSYPVRAEISGSIDGEHFVPLGTTCDTAAFDLGAFPWIAYLRIQDVTDPSDPAFGSSPVGGFDLRSVSGPGCLKYAHCAVSPSSDPIVSDTTTSYPLSLSSIGDDFVLEDPASFEEYGNGSARLVATAHRASDPSTAYHIILSLTGRVESPPPQSPVLELKPSAYSSQGGTIHPTSWYYYKQTTGMMFGKGTRQGEKLPVGGTACAFQIGNGANGRDSSLGGRGALTYGVAASQNTAELRVGLTSCSTQPTPTPTPHATPPSCKTEDISKTLAMLDSNLRGRVTSANRATRLLVRYDKSRASARFKTVTRAKVHNLYTLAWSEVWRHERVIQSCSPSVLCSDVHLEPTQAALAASARSLDAAVDTALLYVQKKLVSRKANKALKELVRQHTTQRATFSAHLAALPTHSTRCQ